MGVLLQNDHPVGGISADVIEDINFDLTTNAKNLPGAINELNGKSSTTVSVTQAEYDALPSSKLTDDIAYYIKDGVPDVDNALWNKVGTTTLETTAKDCSGAINELNSSLTPKEFTVTAGENITITMQKCYKIGKLAVLKITAKATQNITSSKLIINFPSGIRALQDGAVFISGQGSEWGISNFQYTYLAPNGIITLNLTANTFIHIDTTFVIA